MSAAHPLSDERTVRLLDHDPDLGASLRAERLAEAQRSAIAIVRCIPRGRWDPGPDPAALGYGLLLLDGLGARTVLLGGQTSAQLLGRGDLMQFAPPSQGSEMVPAEVRWNVVEPLTIAVLDERFLFTVRRWPEIVAALFERVAAQSMRLATHQALSQLPRVEDRLHGLLWFLAERWGRVSQDGVVLPLRLTHDLLGQLVGAKRPTVSLAVKALLAEGVVARRADGAWLLLRPWEGAEPADHALPPRTGSVGFLRRAGAG